jgi:hypothetical protein
MFPKSDTRSVGKLSGVLQDGIARGLRLCTTAKLLDMMPALNYDDERTQDDHGI